MENMTENTGKRKLDKKIVIGLAIGASALIIVIVIILAMWLTGNKQSQQSNIAGQLTSKDGITKLDKDIKDSEAKAKADYDATMQELKEREKAEKAKEREEENKREAEDNAKKEKFDNKMAAESKSLVLNNLPKIAQALDKAFADIWFESTGAMMSAQLAQWGVDADPVADFKISDGSSMFTLSDTHGKYYAAWQAKPFECKQSTSSPNKIDCAMYGDWGSIAAGGGMRYANKQRDELKQYLETVVHGESGSSRAMQSLHVELTLDDTTGRATARLVDGNKITR